MPEPFLTLLDSRAQVKGSRDPLGIQPIWSALGRQVVTNLTTVSTSIRDFTTLLIGYWFIEQLPDERPLDVFLRWEQWAAYARTKAKGGLPARGVERVKFNLDSGKPVTISAEREHQILSQQQTYGLWGIYSAAARTSGLLEHRNEQRFLTATARNFMEEEYSPRLAAAAGKMKTTWTDLLSRGRVKCDCQGQQSPLLAAIAAILAEPGKSLSDRERNFYRDHLLHGGPDQEAAKRNIQRAAAELVPPGLFEKDRWLSPEILQIWKKSAAKNNEADLEGRLREIEVAEAIFAPSVLLYSFLARQNRQPESSVVRDIRDKWSGAFDRLPIDEFAALQGRIDKATDRRNGGAMWIAVAEALRGGDFQQVLEYLCRINEAVMKERGGSPWITRENGKFQVRYGESSRDLADSSDLPKLWQHSYFLDSLASVAKQLRPHS